jgi:ABC-type branched-subunit amino acid transport system ATPase component
MALLRKGEVKDDAADELVAKDLHKRFGGIEAICDVAFELPRGSVLGVIGPNGSGKTTLINLLTGAYRPDNGSIQIAGVETSRRAAHAIAALGVARTFQNPHVFKTLTVMQNLFVPAQHRRGSERFGQVREEADAWLNKLGLSGFADRIAHELSGGQQKLVEFARAMVLRPRIVLMDEPFAGVHVDVKRILHERITEVARAGETSFMIVSHEIPDLIRLSDSFLCMANGRVLLRGEPAAVCRNPRVVEAYLGATLEGVA